MSKTARTTLTALVVLLIVAIAGPAPAAPAAWQLWRSKSNGSTVCAQVSPGSGWEHADGPYRDAHCTQRGKPGT